MVPSPTSTYWVRIYVGLQPEYEFDSAPYTLTEVVDLCQEFVDRVGLCVNVQPNTYVYGGEHGPSGSEPGVIIELINYPRFPSSERQLLDYGRALAAQCLDAFDQRRVSVMTPKNTYLIQNPKLVDHS